MSEVHTTAVDLFPLPHLNALGSIAPGLLYPHQADGVAFLISKGRAILGDDMGLKEGEMLFTVTSKRTKPL